MKVVEGPVKLNRALRCHRIHQPRGDVAAGARHLADAPARAEQVREVEHVEAELECVPGAAPKREVLQDPQVDVVVPGIDRANRSAISPRCERRYCPAR